MNFVGHTSKHPCSTCEVVADRSTGSVVVRTPFQQLLRIGGALELVPNVITRTSERVAQDINSVKTKQEERRQQRQADPTAQVKLHKSHNGVRGDTVLNAAKRFDVLQDAVTDSMHLVNNLVQSQSNLLFGDEHKVRFFDFFAILWLALLNEFFHAFSARDGLS
jgi:hypothetical protein